MLTKAQVQHYEQVRSQLDSLYSELSALAKKAPDAPINVFKLKIVNQRLEAANTLLVDIHKPFEDFSRFDEASLPTSSDVVLVLSQYLNSLEGWRSANVVKKDYDWVWNTKERDYRANAPSRFRPEEN